MVSKTKSYWKGLQKKGRYRLFGQYRTNLVSKRKRMATTTEIKDTWFGRKERKRTQRSCLKDGSSGRECPGHPGHPAPTACTPPALQALHLRWVCSPFHHMVWMKHTNTKDLHLCWVSSFPLFWMKHTENFRRVHCCWVTGRMLSMHLSPLIIAELRSEREK